MRIGPDFVDPLDRPGRLVLVSVSDDYEPDEDESRSEIDFSSDCRHVVFVDGITGYSCAIEIDRRQLIELKLHIDKALGGLPL